MLSGELFESEKKAIIISGTGYQIGILQEDSVHWEKFVCHSKQEAIDRSAVLAQLNYLRVAVIRKVDIDVLPRNN